MSTIVIQDQEPKPEEAKAEETQAAEVQAATESALMLGQTLERLRTLEATIEEIKAALTSLKAQSEVQSQAIQKLAQIDELILRVQALETEASGEEEEDRDEIPVPIPAEKKPQEPKKEKPTGMISKVFLGR